MIINAKNPDTSTKYGMMYISSIIDKWKDNLVSNAWKKEHRMKYQENIYYQQIHSYRAD